MLSVVGGDSLSDSVRQFRVLLVDDEELVRDVTLRLLKRFPGVVVKAAPGVVSARKSLDEDREPIELALVDLTLTDGLCQDLLEEISERFPTAFLAVMSGYDPTRLPKVPGREISFLQKPFQSSALKALLVKAGYRGDDMVAY